MNDVGIGAHRRVQLDASYAGFIRIEARVDLVAGSVAIVVRRVTGAETVARRLHSDYKAAPMLRIGQSSCALMYGAAPSGLACLEVTVLRLRPPSASVLDSSERTMILAHYYRAMVGRADVWRTRMDTTAHWAIGATAAIVSFALGNPSAPHYVVFIAALLTLCFLILEARRLTFYHLWQRRVLLLERGLIEPALFADGSEGSQREAIRDLGAALEEHLGRTAPTMPIQKAVARRLRRIYLYLFGVQALAWGLKVSSHPSVARSGAEFVARAHVGFIHGGAIIAAVALFTAACLALAIFKGGRHRAA